MSSVTRSSAQQSVNTAWCRDRSTVLLLLCGRTQHCSHERYDARILALYFSTLVRPQLLTLVYTSVHIHTQRRPTSARSRCNGVCRRDGVTKRS